MITHNSELPAAGRSALRGGVVGNFIDNVHVFVPAFALVPYMKAIAGPNAAASSGAIVVIAMLLGRPIGGIIFGHLADRFGRARMTNVAITGTALCALLIALTPSYLAIGAATVIVLITLRFFCGIFVAGEYSAAIPLAMEWSAPKHRGLMSGLILSMAPWAQSAISFSTAGLILFLGDQRYGSWGWRLLFIIACLASLGMLTYYRIRVTDAPVFHRKAKPQKAKVSIRAVLFGRYAPAFWQVFIMMSGLWILTDMTVLVLPGRLTSDVKLSTSDGSIAMGIAAAAQAIFMAFAGHLSTKCGRRRLLLFWGGSATILGPLTWWYLVHSSSLASASILAAALQVVTVSAYGPISAYLSERFTTNVRSTGYGMSYSLSLVLPALYPFYLPVLERFLGHQISVMALIVLGGLLLLYGVFRGPRLSATDSDAEIDEVASAVSR